MIRLGLTGSIGMGKTTTAALFRAEGVPVYDADAAVHALYSAGGGGGPALVDLFPKAVTPDGAVDRTALSARLKLEPHLLTVLESRIHPLLAAQRSAFLLAAQDAGEPLVVLDIPLLYEVGALDQIDVVVVVSAAPAIQRERVLARPGMDKAKLDLLLARQLSDEEKRARADFIIDTGRGIEAARAQVRAVIAQLLRPNTSTT